MRISDWSSDVCSSDLAALALGGVLVAKRTGTGADRFVERAERVAAAAAGDVLVPDGDRVGAAGLVRVAECATQRARGLVVVSHRGRTAARGDVVDRKSTRLNSSH